MFFIDLINFFEESGLYEETNIVCFMDGSLVLENTLKLIHNKDTKKFYRNIVFSWEIVDNEIWIDI